MPTLSAYGTTRLAYHLVGEGEPLICLPGGPMRASAYLGEMGGLGAARQLVLLDLRGTGDSAEPGDPATYRCDRLVDDVEALREHLGLDRIDLLAHSAGGSSTTWRRCANTSAWTGSTCWPTRRARTWPASCSAPATWTPLTSRAW